MYNTAYYLFLSTLIFAPLAFGTVETWAYTVMQLMIFVSALFLVFSRRQETFYEVPGIVPLMLFCGLILFQAMPLPGGIVQLLSPKSHEIYQNTVGVMTPVQWMSISIYPRATLMEFLRVSSYVLFYALSVQFLSNGRVLKKNLAVVTGFGALLAGFVLIEFITRIMNYPVPHDKILWIRESVHGAGSIGPYVNRNHYAGLAAMLFPVALGLFLLHRPDSDRPGVKRRIVDFFLHKRVSALFLYGTAAILIGASLFVTLSRGGIISVTVSMGLFAVFLILKTRQKKVGVLVGVIFLLVLSLTGTEAWDHIFERFADIRGPSGEIQTNRFHYWSDSAGIIRDFPLLGAGAGTFEHIYPVYRTFPGTSRLEHAHSDYVEFSATGGVLLPAMMFFALAIIVARAYHVYRKRREHYAVYLFISSLAAILAIFLHSFVDFNMQVGANGLYFFFILALLVSAANTRFRNGLPATYLKPAAVKFYIPLLAVLCLGAGVYHINFGALLGNYHYAQYRGVDPNGELSPQDRDRMYQAARAAAEADSLNPTYYHALAVNAAEAGQADAAADYYKTLLRLAPLHSGYLQDAAYFIAEEDRPDAAFRLMRAAMAYSPNNAFIHVNYAYLLLAENRVEKGLERLRAAMVLDPDSTDTCLALMAWFDMDDRTMENALPDRVQPHLEFGDYLLSKGSSEKAEAAYLAALSYVPNEEDVRRDFFIRVYRFYQQQKDYEGALRIIRKGIRCIPDDDRLHRIADSLDGGGRWSVGGGR